MKPSAYGQHHVGVALLIPALLGALSGCATGAVQGRPTVAPVVRLTPAPTHDVRATQTAYAQRSVPTPTPLGLYFVKAGDTLSKIADAYETTVDEIIAANGIADPNKIEVGQRLIIPSLANAAQTAESSTPTP